jgi:hypothetical protein
MLKLKLTLSVICALSMTVTVWSEPKPAQEQAPGIQLPQQRPANGWVGGPYKVKAADITGDDVIDLVLSYYPIDVVTVERGDGTGQYTRHKLFQVPFDDRVAIDPVYNIDLGDVDGDGHLDLAIGIGGNLPPGHDPEQLPLEVLRNGWRGRG